MSRMMRRTGFMLFIISALLLVITGCMSGTKESSPPAETEAEGEQPQQPNGDETSQNHANVPPTNIADPTNWKQSPFLEGKGLPPVQERLPKEPKLTNEMPPHELNLTIGKYGGTLRTIRFDPVWDGVVWTLNTEPLVNSPGRLGEEITPNVVRNFSVSPDQKEFTFELREGMKWSDGTPLTTEDVRFTVEDVIMNQELTPIFPQWLRAEGKAEGTPVRLEILDPLTFKLIFDEPYGGFLLQLTTGDYQDLIKPSHYLKSFHIKYADPEELEQKTAEAGFQRGEWFKLFNLKVASGWDSGKPEMIDYPVLYPYLHVKNGDVRLFERNPYYFKIDAEGNQLPYIDQVNSTLVQDLEVGALKILAGEVDFSYEWAPITKVPLYKQNEAKNGTKVLLNTTLHRTANDLFFNMTYEDPTWRKVARDLRFRQALNLALDKAEIVDTVYYGLARPSEMQGTEYNLEEANRLLDEIGMKKGSDGIRTGPDGQKFTMYFTYAAAFPTNQPTAELVAEQWKLLGLDIQLKQVESTLLDTMIEANQVQVTTTFTHGPVMAPWTDWAFNHWGRLWNLWYTTNGAQGERPPDEVLNFYKMVESLRKLPLEEARKKRAELHEEMKQNLWYLIPVDQIVQPVVKNAKLRNLDDAGYQIANSFGGEQWWFDD